jgi:hypothetical protein
MADASWLLDILKVLGGGVLGGVGTAWTARRKKTQMRKLLYRELAHNWGTLNAKVALGEPSSAFAVPEAFVPDLYFEYFKYAKTELNTFHELAESYEIDFLYARLQSVADSSEEDVYHSAVLFTRLMENFLADGELNRRFLNKVVPQYLLKQISPKIDKWAKLNRAREESKRLPQSAEE